MDGRVVELGDLVAGLAGAGLWLELDAEVTGRERSGSPEGIVAVSPLRDGGRSLLQRVTGRVTIGIGSTGD